MQTTTLSDTDIQQTCPLCSGSVPGQNAYRDEALLKHVYLEHDIGIDKAADVFECSKSTIKNWLNHHDISKSRFRIKMAEEELRQLYTGEQWSVDDLAERYDCSRFAVMHRMDIHGIERRGPGEVLHNATDDAYRDEAQLRELYHEEGLSKMDIAERCNVAESTVQYWMNRYGIEARDYADAQSNRHSDKPFNDPDTLYRLYWEEGLNQREIAERLGCGSLAVQQYMQRHGIDVRHTGAHGHTYETERGEYVRSTGERTIANWLHQHDIDYEYEPEIDAGMVPDFLIDNTYVEYWGMVANGDYRERMSEKMDTYADMDITVVDLYPSDLRDLSKKLGNYT